MDDVVSCHGMHLLHAAWGGLASSLGTFLGASADQVAGSFQPFGLLYWGIAGEFLPLYCAAPVVGDAGVWLTRARGMMRLRASSRKGNPFCAERI